MNARKDMEGNISLLKSFLSLDFTVDPNLYPGHPSKDRDRSEGRKLSKKKLNKFITSDEKYEGSDTEQDTKQLFAFKAIKEDDEETKSRSLTPHSSSKPKVISPYQSLGK